MCHRAVHLQCVLTEMQVSTLAGELSWLEYHPDIPRLWIRSLVRDLVSGQDSTNECMKRNADVHLFQHLTG